MFSVTQSLVATFVLAGALIVGAIDAFGPFKGSGEALAAEELKLTKRVCNKAVRHVPTADATYQPGVDVRGRPVAPADIGGGSAIRLPDSYSINLEIDLFQNFGIPLDPRLQGTDLSVGRIDIRGNDVYFNGQPLQDDAERAFVALCQERFPNN